MSPSSNKASHIESMHKIHHNELGYALVWLPALQRAHDTIYAKLHLPEGEGQVSGLGPGWPR